MPPVYRSPRTTKASSVLPPVGEPLRVLVGDRGRGGVAAVGEVRRRTPPCRRLVARLEGPSRRPSSIVFVTNDVLAALVLDDHAEDRVARSPALEADPGAEGRSARPGRATSGGPPRASSNHASTISAAPSPHRCARSRRPAASACSSARGCAGGRSVSPRAARRPPTTSPRSSSIARSQKRSTVARSCVTKTTVRASRFSRRKVSKHFSWKRASPTASTSSTR